MAQSVDDLQRLGRERLDVMVQSATATTASYRSLVTETAEAMKRSVEEAATTVEKMAAVRSLDALVALQSDYARGAVETAVMRWTRMAELQSQIVTAMAAPFQPMAVTRPAAE
ncbi:phasin family protein [Phreatobacter sp.]|uniref:phasin family protein n=1 Tax=Phreatobacter sp. TaxID=1966341 RepID=UPI003F72C098